MTESKKAVFLSYASQDAGSARRICDALRAAGIEVWFDQSELRGGDAWDQMIRRQIHDCALFVPIISQNTASRPEGYFRLEWSLAEQRSHMIARNKAFILPICIDATSDSAADVPECFVRVQWSRLPAGECPPEFAARMRQLLGLEGALLEPPRTAVATAAIASAPPRTSRSWKAVPLLILIVAVLAAGYILIERLQASKTSAAAAPRAPAAPAPPATPAAAPEKSVAILPFADLSEKKDQEYFSDGLSEELINLLAQVRDLRVPTRTSSFYFKGKQLSLPEIAKALNVANVLEGSVRKSGNRLRVTVELVQVSDESRLWSETYDRKLDDIFKVQDDIAGAVVKALKGSLLEGRAVNAMPTTNTEAYTLYLQGRAIQHLGTAADFAKAMGYYQHVVALDPSFAAAWATLAGLLADDYATFRSQPYQTVSVAAHSAAARALSLSPDSPEVQVELGRVAYLVDLDWAASRRAFDRALQLDPGNVVALRFKSYLAGTLGSAADQTRYAELAISRDPLDYWNFFALGLADYCAGRFDAGAAAMRKAFELNPGVAEARSDYARILLLGGNPSAALEEIQREISPNARDLTLPLVFDALGRRGEADETLKRAEAAYGDKQAYRIALIYAQRRDLDNAFRWLDRSYRQHDNTPVFMRHDPLLKNLEGDPRFKVFLREMQVPE
jgi:TolB-like protein